MLNLRERVLAFVGRNGVGATRDRRHARWIHQISRGDLGALSALYDETSPFLFGFVQGILHDRHAAEAALVDVYRTARQQAHTFNPRSTSAMNWLATLARGAAIGQRRDPPPRSLAAASDRRRESAGRALSVLTDEQRSILEMTRVRGLTASEVASVLELREDYVRRQVLLAMQALRRANSRQPDAAREPTGVSLTMASPLGQG